MIDVVMAVMQRKMKTLELHFVYEKCVILALAVFNYGISSV